MNARPTDGRQFIKRYLEALSGQVKSEQLIARFVTDPALVRHILEFDSAFPNYELIAEEVVAEGEFVVVRGRFRGIHSGPFEGMRATGKDVSAELMVMYRIVDDRIAQHWIQFDGAGLRAQIEESKHLAAVS